MAKDVRGGSPRLTDDDAVVVWLLRWKGYLQHDIAARFGVNQGRISEILTGKAFPGSRNMAEKLR